MNKIINKIKAFFSVLMIGLLSFKLGNAGSILYGPPRTSKIEFFSESISWIGITIFLIFAPIIGLKWYQKKGGKKKWPVILSAFTVTFFIILLFLYIIFLYYLQ